MKPEFLDELQVAVLHPRSLTSVKRQVYRLTSPLRYVSALLGCTIEVPGGLVTDFASIPRVAWRYIDPEDPCILYPSVIHDYLYVRGGVLPNGGRTYFRSDADKVLREAMEVAGARLDQRTVVFRSVRWFGAAHWRGELENP